MQYVYSVIAPDLADQRFGDVFDLEFRAGSDARYARLIAERTAGDQGSRSITRRALAHGLAAVSRGSAAAARRLNAVAADDLRRGLAPSK